MIQVTLTQTYESGQMKDFTYCQISKNFAFNDVQFSNLCASALDSVPFVAVVSRQLISSVIYNYKKLGL